MHVGSRENSSNGALAMYLLVDFLKGANDVNNMHGLLQKLKSRVSLSTQHEQEARVTKNSGTSAVSAAPSSSSSSSSSQRTTCPTKEQLPVVLSSASRWKRKYDVFVCHSSAHSDVEEATRLVSFLETSPRNLRCYLWQRDNCPGGAISTEFCQAMQNSHLRALLITPSFVQDDWCNYMMHQALAEGPMSNRMIPLIQNLSHSQYPQELKFYYYIDLSKNPEGYTFVNKTVLKYLEDLIKKEKILDCNVDRSGGGLDGEGMPQGDKITPESAGTSIPLDMKQERDKSLGDAC
ncbi:toll/interleukin-1 receptor domain-containing adapter protein [Mugil cephalus]|uniref:toll/interleukin-1 receptor domain-containing adapter protein n=1 Tax=Mugil cephalus TaxID=48193 RepID=UPI001FB7B0E9|nr:toll/interleukin-1 receptor domain-containing adapter protein [Mugil cephalus]